MSSDIVLLLPYLSKEVNLIGYGDLPFEYKNVSGKKGEKTPADLDVEDKTFEIVFDNKIMISKLVSICTDLVKQIKITGFHSCSDEVAKLNFENIKLQKQLNMLKKDFDKKLDELAAEKELNRQFLKKMEHLKKVIKDFEKEKRAIIEKSVNNENLLKHNLRKQKSDVKKLHATIWKQFNMADKNYFPDNFEILQIDQPDFNKLWSDVKYSSPITKETALKKAVCMFQGYNNFLMERNHIFKRLLLITIEEVNDALSFIHEKMQLSDKFQLKYEISDIFKSIDELNLDAYKQILNKHFDIIRNALELFDEASFVFGEKLFVCWTDITDALTSLENKNSGILK